MRRAKTVLLSVASLSVVAAAAWAQQTYYAQKPSPAIPATGQQAMSYDQALQMQQSWRNQPHAAQSDMGATGSTEATPVGVDPEGNPVYGAAPNSAPQPGVQAPAGNGSQNEAQLSADRLRNDPNAANALDQNYSQPEPNSYAPQAAQPAPQQYQQPRQQYAQQGYGQQSYPQQGYAAPAQPYAYAQPAPQSAPSYGYAQPAPQVVQAPPAVAAEPYGAYPPPPAPVVAYGYPYPYGYPYGYGVRIGGYYRGYPYVGGYYRGPVVRGGFVVRGGYGYAGRGYAGGARAGGFARGSRR